MTRIFSILCCLLLASAAFAQQDETIRLHLKTGNALTGVVKLVDEDGVKLDIGDGIELYIRWSYTRGDRHFELRRRATDFNNIESVMKLADFCHYFAMDEQEYLVLVQALRLNPLHTEARERASALPPVPGTDLPPEHPAETPSDVVERPPQPEPADDPLPPATRGPFNVMLEFASQDNVAEAWFRDELGKLNYRFGSRRDHEIRIELSLTLTLITNPRFMGAELYAIYDGALEWKLYRSGEREPFATGTERTEKVRRNSKAEAMNEARRHVMEDALNKIHNRLERLR
jgi:hypothetical protein